ncbi:hypothetical protein AVEN_56552-1 [Araneus ventricosus]|uniref:Uncharacterized protein n=1 Tax=Araneus ventricosus TaxID=182803 RepID=A0A4Y2HH34_ARAVE|nr:hypothetical protein AVEN_56552-1 [Araneus ventricosus]
MIGEDLQKFSESRVMRTIAIGRLPIRNLPKNGTMEIQAGVFTTFCLKSRQLLIHGKGSKYCSSRATARFRHTLNDSTSEIAIPVAAETWEIPYTML